MRSCVLPYWKGILLISNFLCSYFYNMAMHSIFYARDYMVNRSRQVFFCLVGGKKYKNQN